MKLTVIASVLVMLTSEFSIGLASTTNHSIDSAYHENSGSVSQLLTFFTGYEDPEPPDSPPGGSRYGDENPEPPYSNNGGTRYG